MSRQAESPVDNPLQSNLSEGFAAELAGRCSPLSPGGASSLEDIPMSRSKSPVESPPPPLLLPSLTRRSPSPTMTSSAAEGFAVDRSCAQMPKHQTLPRHAWPRQRGIRLGNCQAHPSWCRRNRRLSSMRRCSTASCIQYAVSYQGVRARRSASTCARESATRLHSLSRAAAQRARLYSRRGRRGTQTRGTQPLSRMAGAAR